MPSGRPVSPFRYTVDENGCWIWSGWIDKNGYGRMSAGWKMHFPHRWHYEKKYGKTDLPLDHLCRVRACCNPDHLEAVTHMENVRRSAKTRLGKYEVEEIRKIARFVSHRRIGRTYGFCGSHISRIVKGVRWADEKGAP